MQWRQDLQIAELRDLIGGVAASADTVDVDVSAIRRVPPEKRAFNNLPSHWRMLIAGGWQNTHLMSAYITQHQDPLIGETVAQVFRTRYRYLKDQHLQPAAIMLGLYDSVVGVGAIVPARQVAAQALLAFLFESCDIFESPPQLATTP